MQRNRIFLNTIQNICILHILRVNTRKMRTCTRNKGISVTEVTELHFRARQRYRTLKVNQINLTKKTEK